MNLNVSDIVSIVTSIVTAVALVASVVAIIQTQRQIKIEKEDIKSKYDLEKKKEALKQSDWFAKNVDKMGLIYDVFTRDELDNYNNIDLTEQELRFTQDEMSDKIGKIDARYFYSNYIKRVKDPKVIFDEMVQYDILSENEKKYYIEVFSDKKEIKEIRSLEIIRRFESIMSNLLNELEIFSMSIISGIVDEELIYPSTHQFFIYFVKSQYFNISYGNPDGIDRYYRHIVSLFNNWNQKTIKENEKIKTEKRNSGNFTSKKHKVDVI